MTYNIQFGRGIDGRIDLDRIADVIAAFEPDVLLLQEVDIGLARSGHVHQVDYLAARLGMPATFAPTIETSGARYGNATFSRLPVLAHRRVGLPFHAGRARSISRSALVTKLAWTAAGTELQIVNTHLSVVARDRPAQAATLAAALGTGTTLLAGDFNCTPWSTPFRMLCRELRSVTRTARTWPSPFPVVPIDHIMIRGPLHVIRAGAWAPRRARNASDHLPVIAELEHRPGAHDLSRPGP